MRRFAPLALALWAAVAAIGDASAGAGDRAAAGGSAAEAPGFSAPRSYAIEAFLGTSWNLPTPLWIQQDGEPDLRTTAHYETRAFDYPLYYALRLATQKDRVRWELELIHHKIYMVRRPDEVQRFAISHGYNLLLVNRAVTQRGRVLRLGAGLVIAHPETRIRGRDASQYGGLGNGGYHLSGPAVQVAVGRLWPVARFLNVQIEGKLSAAYARVPIADGHARAPNVAFHLLAGLALGTARR